MCWEGVIPAGMGTSHSFLICTYSAGFGHHRVSTAIEEAFLEAEPGAKVYTLDPLSFGRPAANSLLVGFYLQALKRFPAAYRTVYTLAEGTGGKRQQGLMNWLLEKTLVTGHCLRKLDLLYEELKPDIVICCHPFAAMVMSAWKRRNSRGPVLFGVVTDFTIHPFWAALALDGYFTAAPDLAGVLISQGVPAETVWPVGIPVTGQFLSRQSRQNARAAMGLDPEKKTVLIMGGGLGLGELAEAVQGLGSRCPGLQIMVVTGHNRFLCRRLAALITGLPAQIKVFAFVENIAVLMKAADLIVTKPGGVTLAEALAVRVPLVLWQPIPGQEERNAAYLLSHGLAYMAAGRDELVATVRALTDREPGPDYHGKFACDKVKRRLMAVRHRKAAASLAGIVRRRYM